MIATNGPQVVFVFPGQGSQWVGMGRFFFETEPTFRAVIERFDEYLRAEAGWSLVEFLFGEAEVARWEDVEVVQPALVAVEVALAALWRDRGLHPDAVMGQSVGEVAAACVAGVFTEAEAVRVSCAYSRAFRAGHSGGMALVGLDTSGAQRVTARHPGQVFVSGRLSPHFTTLSGTDAVLDALGETLRAEGVYFQRIRVGVAAHCPFAAPAAEALMSALPKLTPRRATVPVFSTVTGGQVEGTALDAEYWARNLHESVDLLEPAEQFLAAGPTAFVEVSPNAILSLSLEDALEEHAGPHAAASCVVPTQVRGQNPERTLQASLERLTAFSARPEVDRPDRAPTDETLDLNAALRTIGALREQLAAHGDVRGEPLAVVGMACRLPGGIDGPDTLWEALRAGREVVADIPEDRWDVDAFYDPAPGAPAKMYIRRGGFVAGMDLFDAGFFHISPREAQGMDPQHRLLLEVTWEALEHAGIAPDSVSGTPAGVFTGIAPSEHELLSLGNGAADPYAVIGSANSVASGRVAYVLGLHGPAVSVDTACSSSLTALHLAGQSLRTGEVDLALVGGVNAILAPTGLIARCQSRMMSVDGRCHTFDAAANGYVQSEGCGVIVLKRLSDAQKDGDRILAVVRSTAANQDGRSAGMMAPNGAAQEAVIRSALTAGRLTPDDVQYVEAHGTGTPVGDPLELGALQAVFGGREAGSLLVGTAKTNLGHCESAAGVVGVIKAVLALQHAEIPPHPHLDTPTPAFDWEAGNLVVPTSPTPWPATTGPRRAGVSSFGISGTNVHVILEEPPEALAETASTKKGEAVVHLLPLSAQSGAALDQVAERYARFLEGVGESDFGDVCATAAQGRAHFEHRLAVVTASPAEARDALAGLLDGDPAGVLRSDGAAEETPEVAFLFTGQGAQYPGMSRDLYDAEPAFRQALDRCAALAGPLLERPLLDVMFGATEADGEQIHQTAYTQPALFAVEYALVELWRSWGVVPTAVMGHSIGEYVAACVAGVFSLEDALRLVVERGRLMQALPGDGGQMAAVFAPEATVRAAVATCGAAVDIAGVNGPENVVVSGAGEAVIELCREMEAEGILTQPLKVSHAFHSSKMDPMLAAFEAAASGVAFSEPRIPLISNVTGRSANPGEVTHAAYWARHVRHAVQFRAGMEALWDLGLRTFVEVGPHPVLLGMGRSCVPDEGATWVPSLQRGRASRATLLAGLGRLYVQGLPIAWAAVAPLRRRRALPTYPFQHRRYPIGGDGAGVREFMRRFGTGAAEGHPLLGQPLSSPLLPGPLFESRLSTSTPAYLADHRIYDVPVLPGMGYLEMASAAARTALGEGSYDITRVTIKKAMVFSNDAARAVQVALTPEEGGRHAFQVFSRDSEDGTWTEHATGYVSPLQGAPPPPRFHLVDVADEMESSDPAEYYEAIEERGSSLNGWFVNMKRLNYVDGEAAVGRVCLPAEALAEAEAYGIHPALLDGCLQVMCSCIPESEDVERTHVPLGAGRFRLYRSGVTDVWCEARIVGEAPWDQVTGSFCVYDDEGQPVAEVEDVELQRVSAAAIRQLVRQPIGDWMYDVAWQLDEAPAEATPPGGRWLLFADRCGVATALADRLRADGAVCSLAYAGDGYEQTGDATWTLDATRPEDVYRLVREALGSDEDEWEGVVYLWTLDAPEPNVASILEDQHVPLGGLLHVVQAVAGTTPRFVLVTQGSVSDVASGDGTPTVAQSPAWGLRRTIATEHPEMRSLALDLPVLVGPAEAAATIAEALGHDDAEAEVVYRSGQRYVARLRRHVDGDVAWPWSDDHPYSLNVAQHGDLDRLALVPLDRRVPGPGEVEIRVRATGLNFRDVLNALGMYPGEAGPLGGECAGRVVAVGEGVTHLAEGDEVVALANGAFRTFVTVPAAFAVRKPVNAPLAAGATLPITFLTAYHGLHRIARLQPGQRVLVHAAAGGVGMASVQLALQAGAEVFGTAGSPEKRAVVRDLGVAHVSDSRSLAFADDVREWTGGEGVDVVLNALTGDFIPAGLDLLKDGGHFLELGKREVWAREQVDAVNPTVHYTPYDLGDVMRDEPEAIYEMLQAVVEAVEAGALTPLPVTPFSVREASEAFRFMAQARHIGKVVVLHPETPAAGVPLVRDDATYLITGGLGGLGLRLAERLAERGAQSLVLVGRRAPSETADALIEALRARDVTVHVASADVADAAAVEALMARIQSSMPPLRGVFHAAGVVEDALLVQQDWPQVARVLAPKVVGGWHLHEATRSLPLDHFVLFSSVAAVMGSAGQGAYAAANMFLDRLAARRRAEGLPALSVNWGPWDEAGMAARMDARYRQQMRQAGLELIPVESGLDALEQLMREALRDIGPAAVVVQPFTWAKVAAASGGVPSLLRALATSAPSGLGARRPTESNKAILRAVEGAEPEERHRLVVDDLQARIAKVTGMVASDVPTQRPLTALGLESLMAVEFKSQVELTYGVNLSVTMLLRGATLDDVARHALGQMFGAEAAPVSGDGAGTTPPDPERLLAQLDSLTEAEVDAFLRDMGDTEADD